MNLIKYDLNTDIFRKQYLRKNNRLELDSIEAPRRSYKKDLVTKYILALSSIEPVTQFISMYHIIEYFIEDVAKENIISLVKDELTMPDFSYKNNNKILNLVDAIIKNTNQYSYSKNEVNGVKLVLKKYLEKESIIDSLNEIYPELHSYYSKNIVSFSDGDKVLFDSNQEDEFYNSLANRVYKTRNAIVHSKSEELKDTYRFKYNPLKHSNELNYEIYLLRVVAEKIIIGDSKIID